MRAHLRTDAAIALALADAGVTPGEPGDGLVFQARGVADDWSGIRAELIEAFALAQAAARSQAPILFIVSGDDLLGRNGAPSAMVATGLLSAARTAAAELARAGTPVNTLAALPHTPVETIARWAVQFLSGGTTGELVRLGSAHIGKALP